MTHKNLIALSFDIEDWYHTPLVTGSSFSRYKRLEDFLNDEEAVKQAEDCITQETLRLLDILDSYQAKATFFMVADVAQRYQEITSALRQSQHEVASHSLTHQTAINAKTKQNLQTEEQWYTEQVKAKQILEEIFEEEIIGFRAPAAYFANWMIPLLEKAGFKYDSSIAYNSLYNKTNVTLREIPSVPYFINSDTMGGNPPQSQLMELPWSNLKITSRFVLPVGGAYFFRLLGYNYFKHALGKALRTGDTMFYMHPYDITTKPIPAVTSNRPFFWVNKGLKTEKNFIKLLKAYKGRFATCRDVYLKNLTS